MFIVFARDVGEADFWGMGATPDDAWADLNAAADGDTLGDHRWYRAEPVTVTQKTVFTVEG